MANMRTRGVERPRQRQIRKRRMMALLVIAAALAAIAALGVGVMASTSASASTRIELDGKPLLVIDLEGFDNDGQFDDVAFREEVVRRLTPTRTLRGRRAAVTYKIDRRATSRRAAALGLDGGTVEARAEPAASKIRVPVLKQRYRNNCETASLAAVMAVQKERISQAQLQTDLARSGPVDPKETPDGRVWGDPDKGFVGRVAGGGVAGGFGVYPQPIAKLARLNGVVLKNMTGVRPTEIYARVRSGRPVMTWIGLSDGPYGEWLSPEGKAIRVNWGEHVVVLSGISQAGALRVMNPLKGTVETWDQATFESKWALLGERALGAS